MISKTHIQLPNRNVKVLLLYYPVLKTKLSIDSALFKKYNQRIEENKHQYKRKSSCNIKSIRNDIIRSANQHTHSYLKHLDYS